MVEWLEKYSIRSCPLRFKLVEEVLKSLNNGDENHQPHVSHETLKKCCKDCEAQTSEMWRERHCLARAFYKKLNEENK